MKTNSQDSNFFCHMALHFGGFISLRLVPNSQTGGNDMMLNQTFICTCTHGKLHVAGCCWFLHFEPTVRTTIVHFVYADSISNSKLLTNNKISP